MKKGLFEIKKWSGLNESAGSSDELLAGQAREMNNFRISPDGSLVTRPGVRTIPDPDMEWSATKKGVYCGRVGVGTAGFDDGMEIVIHGLDMPYTVFQPGAPLGTNAGREVVLFAMAGKIYRWEPTTGAASDITAENLVISGSNVSFFGFENKVYIQDGEKYCVWDGEAPVHEVSGYVPTVFTAMSPSGVGTELEPPNLLTQLRKCEYINCSGTTAFTLPEKGVAQITSIVKHTNAGGTAAVTGFSFNSAAGTFTCPQMTDAVRLVVTYRIPGDYSDTVKKMRFAEIFGGAQDSRLFLYGDGTNNVIYTGLDINGMPRGDYFPALNTLSVGENNTPVTALCRHGTRLAAFKTASAYEIDAELTELAGGKLIPVFTTRPVSRNIGNEVPGEAELVDNKPRTLFSNAVYEWSAASGGAGMTADERICRSISERAHKTLTGAGQSSIHVFNDTATGEYYLLGVGKTVVHNYRLDVWYAYDWSMQFMFRYRGELFGILWNGDFAHISDAYRRDGDKPILARWVSGAISFGADFLRKYSAAVFASLVPRPSGGVHIRLRTDRHTDVFERGFGCGRFLFEDVSFSAFSFNTSDMPKQVRSRVRARKFSLCELELRSGENGGAAEVSGLGIDVGFGEKI
ncbi:MAG: hypothetical protein LBQ91_00500 [Oscillospiraceae bacterium]|jgi:hypothetical protein|nr:hypothetical protein [Oscillospiraceae bacterium]